MTPKFCVFIITHKRPDNQKTLRTLKRRGYTGPVWLVVDDKDPTLKEYREKYGEQVIVFSKDKVAQYVDEGDNFPNQKSEMYARNACFDIAEELGYEFFIELDDDYSDFRMRFSSDRRYTLKLITDLDGVFSVLMEFYASAEKISSLAIGQGGDYIGGSESNIVENIIAKRKAMNSFFCSTRRRFRFDGKLNDDVIAYTYRQRMGLVFLTTLAVSLNQAQTQTAAGGMSDAWSSGTYVKSFYAVMYSPSCVKVSSIGPVDRRIHHMVNWNAAAPCILRESTRKRSEK